MDQEQEEKKEKERNSGLSVMRHVDRTKGPSHVGEHGYLVVENSLFKFLIAF